ncbi:MAG TPA: hypothetical protein VFF53_07285 [Geobacteraceae bacterium]|nr:hypothetical protein [Geobacteraceae bacterium]
MEKERMIETAKEKLTPFETGNIIDFVQNLTLKSAMEHPLVIVIFLVFAVYAVVTRSKFILLFLFAGISIMLLVRYTLSPEVVGGGISLSSTLPFLGGGLVIGGALIYLAFIKHD